MSNINPSNSSKSIAKIILILVVIAAIWFLVSLVNNRINNTLNPLQQMNHELGTQVANLLHPTPTIIPDPVTIINEVQSLARLETIRYNVEKVITAETGQGAFAFLIGDRLLLVAHGLVIAGIDMSKIKPEELWLDQGALNVRLPAAEVFVATLDNEKTKVYERDTGLLKSPDPNMETTARQAAEEEILKAALEDGILDQAMTNAQLYLHWFFETLGYKQINFVLPTP
ncbi:MAG: DUF4230 domain-containing protein [Anaerolineales bacterium]